MAKKIYAVTNIKGSNVEVVAGDEVPQDRFSKEELKSLYDAGALEVKEVEERQASNEPTGPDTSVQEQPEQPVEE